MIVIKRDGNEQNFNQHKMNSFIAECITLSPPLMHIDMSLVSGIIKEGLGRKMSADSILKYVAECVAALSTKSYDYALLAGRIDSIELVRNTPSTFKEAMIRAKPLLDKAFVRKIESHDYDQYIIGAADYNYDIFGIRTLKKSYLLRDENGFIERPQYMLMRVAVFLTDTPEEAVVTYKALSEGKYTHASPTLFHSGLKKSQLASCFLVQMEDDSIAGIYNTLKKVALISKGAGGLGISCSNIRASGSIIKGSGGRSNGLTPMLRVFNNTARYVDQGGGKRKGSFAIFLEPWHGDIESFLELKLNHGIEEERARDLFYSLWISDLFMERVKNDGMWSLFCPTMVPELQESHGEEFKKHYLLAEKEKKYIKQIKAQTLWKKILTTQQETGTPYLMYKDACNKKSNQQNLGTIKSSNLCAEIVEYTNKDEIAVCTLASIALPRFVSKNSEFMFEELVETAKLVTKNLNHCIDKSSYPLEEAKTSNTRHRPIAIGVQGLSDVFNMMTIPYDSPEAKTLNSKIFESIYFGSVQESINLAKKYGSYSSFEGSPASQGKLQFDLWGVKPDTYDWDKLKLDLRKYGMRNSLLTGCMPTASSASILGNTESFEPRTSNMYVRRVLSGEFIILNKYLENECRRRGIWNEEFVNNMIANRGSIQNIHGVPEDMKKIYKTVWEISQKHLIDLSAGRGPYIDQSQSLNLYQKTPTLGKLSSMHMYAFNKGLKTGIYYLRTLPKSDAIAFTARKGATMVENAIQACSRENKEACMMCSS
jgi:ribonucleoside-diphosphate reductase alpha chain